MDPDYERRLRNEVIYLHALWHQGPPTRPTQQPTPSRLLHHPSNPPQFKKEERIKPVIRQSLKPTKNRPPSPASGNQWPCKPTSSSSPATTSGWATSWPQPNSQTLLPSPAEKAKLAANRTQIKALQTTKEFFKSDGDDDDDEGDSEDDDDDMMEVEEYTFFVEVFMEDRELREYYEKNYSNGEFSCLVCGGLGKKLSVKKFKDCVALVQHAISIAKTKKRRAHRAYGQAICKVLGWDIARLPTIVSALSEKRELSLNNSGQGEVEDQGKCKEQENVCEGTEGGYTALENKEDLVDVSNPGQVDGESQVSQENVGEGTNDGSTSLEIEEAPADVRNGGELPSNECVSNEILPNNDESTVSKNSLTGPEASKSPEGLCQTVPEIVENKETELVEFYSA